MKTDYVVVDKITVKELEKEVLLLLKAGYELVGASVPYVVDGTCAYTQTLIKQEHKNENKEKDIRN